MSTLNVGILNSTNRIKLPSYTTVQRDALSLEVGLLIYNSTTLGIEFYNGTEWVNPGKGKISATGGTVTTVGLYKVHTFFSNGSFVVTGSGTAEVLVVAGGGGGGSDMGGGGGAGGLIYN